MVKCNICNSESEFCFEKIILNKYKVKYYKCNVCGLHFTEQPYWLDEAYSDAIAQADTGLVIRNLSISKKLASLIFFMGYRKEKLVDISGGYGLLVRLMRDMGFDYYWEDKYSDNILAKGFDAQECKYKLASAFEVLEHLPDPVSFLRGKKEKYGFDVLVATTTLFRGQIPRKNWDYYSESTGQHITFYNKNSMRELAGKIAMKYFGIGNYHIFYSSVHTIPVKSILAFLFEGVLSLFIKRVMKSKTYSDHLKVKHQ